MVSGTVGVYRFLLKVSLRNDSWMPRLVSSTTLLVSFNAVDPVSALEVFSSECLNPGTHLRKLFVTFKNGPITKSVGPEAYEKDERTFGRNKRRLP